MTPYGGTKMAQIARERDEALRDLEQLQDAAEVLLANYDMQGLTLRYLHPYVEALREVLASREE